MFGKGRLIREGAQAEAVVVESHFYASRDGGVVSKYKVRLRVHFDDGSTAEVSAKLERHEVGQHTEGDLLPVRYDPSDRSKIEIDVPELKARHEANIAQAKASAVARGESQLEAATSATPGTPAPAPAAVQALPGTTSALAHLRDQTAAARGLSEALTEIAPAMMRAKASGDQAEVERLRAELKQRMAESPGLVDQRTAGVASGGPTSDPLERLQKLADLHDRGVLSDTEFAAEKTKILGA